MNKSKILFLCKTNSCRSQMAEGIIRHYYADMFDVYSAGTMATFVHPLAIRVMAEIGIDISSQKSKTVEELIDRVGPEFDYVITLCENDAKEEGFWVGESGRTLGNFDQRAHLQTEMGVELLEKFRSKELPRPPSLGGRDGVCEAKGVSGEDGVSLKAKGRQFPEGKGRHDEKGDICPFIGKAKASWSWNLEDPAKARGSEEEVLEVFRMVRDEIRSRIDG